jgi:acetyl esterase
VPLDPQARAQLDRFAVAGAPPVSTQTPEVVRAGFVAMNDAVGPPEEPVPVTAATVPGPGGDIPVRVHRPPADGPLPVVVWFHGGGFVIGDLDACQTVCQRLAARVPAVVVAVGYRLAPEHRFPAALDDAVAATAWVADHAAELGGDPARLAVAGDSAGGNLATGVARRARDAGGPTIAFELLVYPVTDCTSSLPSHREFGSGYLLDTETLDWFYDHYLGGADPRDPDASPLFAADLSGLPPALVVTAGCDPLRDEGEAYAGRLREAGVPVTATRYDGMFHGFYGLDRHLDAAGRCTAQTVATLRDALA